MDIAIAIAQLLLLLLRKIGIRNELLLITPLSLSLSLSNLMVSDIYRNSPSINKELLGGQFHSSLLWSISF